MSPQASGLLPEREEWISWIVAAKRSPADPDRLAGWLEQGRLRGRGLPEMRRRVTQHEQLVPEAIPSRVT